MIDLNFLAILAATVAVFVASSIYYSVLAPRLVSLSPAWAETSRPADWKMILEAVRAFVTATVVAALARLLGITDLAGAILLALALWVGFPLVLLTGSVIHENVPWKLAAAHVGDWLLKLLIISVIVTLWT